MDIFNITLTAQGRGLYAAHTGDRLLVEKTRTPIFAAARVLMDAGYDADDVLVARHAGSDTVSLRGKLAILAGLTVYEGDHDGLRIAKYRTLYEDMPLPPVRVEQGGASMTLQVLS